MERTTDLYKRKLQSLLLRMANRLPGTGLRCKTYRAGGIEIGGNACIDRGAIVWKGVKLGENVEVRSNAFLRFVTLGDNSVVDRGALLLGVAKEKFIIGKNSYIGFYATLDGSGGLEIGNYVHIASPSVGIWTHSTVFTCLRGCDINDNRYRVEEPVKIEDNVFIGGNVTIYPGIKIGHHSIILPNSAVNREVPPYSVAGGCPAKIKKRIKITKKKIEFIATSKSEELTNLR